MSSTEMLQIEQRLRADIPTIATAWFESLIGDICDPDKFVELRMQINGLTERIVNILAAELFDVGKAQAVGVSLTAVCGAPLPAVLANTQRVLSNQLPGLLPDAVANYQVPQLLGNIAIGFFQQIDEAEQAHPAVPEKFSTGLQLSPHQVEDLNRIKALDLAVTNKQLRHEIAEQKQIEAELRQYNRELTLVSRASQVFYSTLDLDQVVVTILAELHSLIDVYAYSVWLINWNLNEIVCWRATDAHREVMLGWRLTLGQGVVGQTAQQGKSFIVPDTRANQHHFKGIDQQLGIEIRSILSVPLQGRQDVVGVIQIVDATPNRFGEAEKTLLESLAEAAGIAIENAQLHEEVQQDAESKSVMLREINHRVKNNLAVIKSILHLKRNNLATVDSAGYQSLTEDVMNHVQGLAAVHNLLSTSNWTPVPVSELVSRIIDTSLKVLSPGENVSVKIIPSSVWVTADQAHHLALITNELVTNTVKHALPKAQKLCEITVQVSLNNKTIRVEFRDNGPGYPEDLFLTVAETHNFGLELVQQIVYHNLQGDMEIFNDNGAVTVIEFGVANENNNTS